MGGIGISLVLGDIDGSGADALAAQKVLAAALESIRTGAVVTVS